MRGLVLAVAAGVLFGGGDARCWACLNDTSTRAAEDEFRSRYETTPPPHDLQVNSERRVNLLAMAAIAVGSGVAVGSFVVASRTPRKPRA